MNDGSDGHDKRHDRGIFERPPDSGVWWVCYFDENGRKHREKVGPKGLTIKVYQKRKNEIQERRFFPERIRRREVLLSAMIDDYLSRAKEKLRSYRDAERYGRVWKGALGNKALRSIVPGDVERYLVKRRAGEPIPAKSERSEKSRKAGAPLPSTINRELAFLRRVFNVAIEDGNADANPVRPKLFAKENNRRERYLTEEEELTLREKLGEGEWPSVALAIGTGLRRGEQFSLRWENVDFTSGILTVPRSKSGKARHVPMNDTVRELLRDLPSRMKSEWVFPSESGETPMDARNYLGRVFSPAVKRAAIAALRWHDLRHYAELRIMPSRSFAFA